MDLSKTELDLWAKNVAASLDVSCHHAIEGHTLDSIMQEIANILHIEGFSRHQSREIQEKLNDYRYVGEICDLFRGRHIRWIRVLDLSSKGREDAPIVKPNLTEGTGTNPPRVLTEGTNPPRVLTEGTNPPRVLTEGTNPPRVLTEGTNPPRVLTEGTNPPRVLTNGGIVTDIKFQENGIYIQCKNTRNQFMQFRFDHCLVFQKLTPEECILLLCKKNL